MIVRNPLEHLLSAFSDKLSTPLIYNSKAEFELYKKSIWTHYHPEKLKEWIKEGHNEKLQLDFETFLRWVIDTPNLELNEHFTPIINIAQPCRIKYNFYGNFKMYSTDMKAVVERLDAPQEWYRDKSYYEVGKATKDKMVSSYSRVSKKVKELLIQDISEDLEFYYTLFPEEAGSHIDILGL